jgi:hypothetical protein
MAENMPMYAYTGILGEKGYMGVFRGARIKFQGLGGGGTHIRMLCKRSHSTDNFIAISARTIYTVLNIYVSFSCAACLEA